MSIEKKKTVIIALIAVLWLVCMVCGWVPNLFVLGMCLGVVLILLHILLGVAKKGVVSKKFLVYPTLVWAILWIAGFILSKYYSDMFLGIIPSFKILGFHPSFAFTILFYWIGGMLTTTVGQIVYMDEWLSEKDWNDFCSKVKELKQEMK